MQELNLYQLFTEKLNNKKIPYAVTGSVASIVYGEPRMTHYVKNKCIIIMVITSLYL
jgi:hypothetical protein